MALRRGRGALPTKRCLDSVCWKAGFVKQRGEIDLPQQPYVAFCTA